MRQNKGANRFQILKDMSIAEQSGIALGAGLTVATVGMIAAAPVVIGIGAWGGIAAAGVTAARAIRKRNRGMTPGL